MKSPCYLQNYRSVGLRYHILTWHKARWAHLLSVENLYLWILITLQDIQSQMEPNKLQRIVTWSAVVPHDATPKMASHLSWYHSMIFASENRRKNSFSSYFNFMKLIRIVFHIDMKNCFYVLALCIVYKRVIFVDPITAVGSKPPATTRYHM